MSAIATSSTLLVNDRPRTFVPGSTVRDLIRDLGLSERKAVAVAINGAVTPRAEWPARLLAPDDWVLVIQATQGG